MLSSRARKEGGEASWAAIPPGKQPGRRAHNRSERRGVTCLHIDLGGWTAPSIRDADLTETNIGSVITETRCKFGRME